MSDLVMSDLFYLYKLSRYKFLSKTVCPEHSGRYQPHSRLSTHDYSVRSDFTGFATAAFIAWKLTVNNAINMAIEPAAKNIHQEIVR
jgi:hypothetical protein